MKQFFILMLALFSCALINAQKSQKSETSGTKATTDDGQKTPQQQMRFNYAEQEAIVKKFTQSFDSLTPMQKNMFFTNVKHIMEPEVTKIESGVMDSDPPSDAIVLFNGKDLNEWEEVSWGMRGPGAKKPITWVIKDGGMQPTSYFGYCTDKTCFQRFSVAHRMEDSDRFTGNSYRSGQR